MHQVFFLLVYNYEDQTYEDEILTFFLKQEQILERRIIIMSYVSPISRPVPFNQLCEYGCGRPATTWFKIPKKWCCSKTANGCPEMKRKNQIKRAQRKKIKEAYGLKIPYWRDSLYRCISALDRMK